MNEPRANEPGKTYVTDPVLRVILMALERGAFKPKEPKK